MLDRKHPKAIYCCSGWCFVKLFTKATLGKGEGAGSNPQHQDISRHIKTYQDISRHIKTYQDYESWQTFAFCEYWAAGFSSGWFQPAIWLKDSLEPLLKRLSDSFPMLVRWHMARYGKCTHITPKDHQRSGESAEMWRKDFVHWSWNKGWVEKMSHDCLEEHQLHHWR